MQVLIRDRGAQPEGSHWLAGNPTYILTVYDRDFSVEVPYEDGGLADALIIAGNRIKSDYPQYCNEETAYQTGSR